MKSNMCTDWIDRLWCDRLLGYLLGQMDALIMAICQRIYCHSYLNVWMIVGSQVEPIRVGTSLDGSLHPLMTTILLNESDVEFDRHGHLLCDMPDGWHILCKSRRVDKRTRSNIIALFVEGVLRGGGAVNLKR